MCNRVFVLSSTLTPLMPTHPARARELLKKGMAAVFRMFPFTIVLQEKNSAESEKKEIQEVSLKIDPGSKHSGIAVIAKCKRGFRLLTAINLKHRGDQIKNSLLLRRQIRRSRRARKTRYRMARFCNRTRPKGWLPPSLMSRVSNVDSLAKKIQRYCPLARIDVETVRFDLQKCDNPEISGIEYKQGDLLGYEIKEYLLEKWQRKCAYCDIANVPLEVEHIVARSKGGSNRVSNLTLSCKACNSKKGNQAIGDFVTDKKRLERILVHTKKPLKDAAAVNSTRYAIGSTLKKIGLKIDFWSGGRTKKNRVNQGYKKDHWIDAACVGESGKNVYFSKKHRPLFITAQGRGSRQMCRVSKYGFPRTGAKFSKKRKFPCQTGDFVGAVVTSGKKVGRYLGRVAVRETGNCNIKVGSKTIEGIHMKFCRVLQKGDGYSYAH